MQLRELLFTEIGKTIEEVVLGELVRGNEKENDKESKSINSSVLDIKLKMPDRHPSLS